MPEPGLGYCGLDCGHCPVFVATATNDDTLRRQTAQQWSTLYGEYLEGQLGRRRLEAHEMSCHGCRAAEVFVGCTVCAIRKCARERGVASCAFCAGYEACAILGGFCSAHPDARAALEKIRAAPS